MFLSVLMISFSPLLMLYSNLMLVPRFFSMMFVFVNLSKVLVVISRAVPSSVVSERVILSVLGKEVFPFPWVPRFHCAVEPAVSLSGCNVVDVYVGDLIYCGVYDFGNVVSPISPDFGLS